MRQEILTLESLSLKIGSKSLEIREYLDTLDAPLPSFDEESYLSFEDDSNVKLRNLRNTIINHAQDIIRLASGPTDHVLSLAFSVK
jgi:hypothetical protein